MVWYSHLFENFPQFVVIHRIKGSSVASKAEVVVFLELSCFVDDPTDVGNLISVAPAAAAKSLQLCPTLCNPIVRSPPCSTIPGILQARTLKWVAISFSNA